MPACSKPRTEILLNSIIASLIIEKRLPHGGHGSLVDGGAFNGEWACYWATVANGTRTVIAIDPDVANIEYMRSQYGLATLRPHLALLSDGGGSSHAGVDDAKLGAKPSAFLGGDRIRTYNQSAAYRAALRIPVETIDDLFALRWHGERCALLHLDLEGSELLALHGANATLRRDRPVVVTELNVHGMPELGGRILRHLDGLKYDSFLVEEVTGIRADFRNVIHFPREYATQRSNSVPLQSRSLC